MTRGDSDPSVMTSDRRDKGSQRIPIRFTDADDEIESSGIDPDNEDEDLSSVEVDLDSEDLFEGGEGELSLPSLAR